MSGSHYTLQRDLINPMDEVKEKACAKCKVVKPNTFKYFGKKLWRTRHEHTTLDVCKQCRNSNISSAMRKLWEHRKAEELDALGLTQQRVLQAQAVQSQTTQVQAVQTQVVDSEALPDAVEFKPIPLNEAVGLPLVTIKSKAIPDKPYQDPDDLMKELLGKS